jgi:hypothetical protein
VPKEGQAPSQLPQIDLNKIPDAPPEPPRVPQSK